VITVEKANQTTDEIVAALKIDGKIVKLPETIDPLAASTDSMCPAHKKIYPEQIIRDSTGKVIKIIPADTVQIAAAPALKSFPGGRSDYSMGYVVKPGHKFGLYFTDNDSIVCSQEITDLKYEWYFLDNLTASLHTGN
jgi:hypothetical protein